MSNTVTSKSQVERLPDASVTVNNCVFTPTGNEEPLAKPELIKIFALGQLSVNTGAE